MKPDLTPARGSIPAGNPVSLVIVFEARIVNLSLRGKFYVAISGTGCARGNQ